MLRRPVLASLLVVAALSASAVIYAQLETADRGILPLDSSNTLEIGGIHVDASGSDAESARYAGWRMAQRQGFKALWAKMHNAPIAQAPNLPDGALDQIVSSINVEREQIGPGRYIADLGVQFDRSLAAQYLGVEGSTVQRAKLAEGQAAIGDQQLRQVDIGHFTLDQGSDSALGLHIGQVVVAIEARASPGDEQLPGANTAAVDADAGEGGVSTDLLTTQCCGQLAE